MSKEHLVVDGSNIATEGRTAPSLAQLNDATRNILTVEDPIEYIHHHRKSIVNQREIGADTSSFPTALKYVLRQDPDIILIGEMRDLETIEAALTIAETGHLVFGTLHTTTAPSTIDRIIAHKRGGLRIALTVLAHSFGTTVDGLLTHFIETERQRIADERARAEAQSRRLADMARVLRSRLSVDHREGVGDGL